MKASQAKGKDKQTPLLSNRCARTTMKRTIPDYLLNHEGGNSSQKTLRWHRTECGLCEFPGRRARITPVGEVNTSDNYAWFASLRKTPPSRGRLDSERTSQTCPRWVRAFFHWLMRRETV